MAVAVFKDPAVTGEAIATPRGRGTALRVKFTALPPGKHGFHIHVAGDLRGEGCTGACSHLHIGAPATHGGRPGTRRANRHSGDLGNVEQRGHGPARYSFFLSDLKPEDLWGRTLIVHADEDDLGTGPHEDSKTTGHSGARIGCAIFGRLATCVAPKQSTRRRPRKQRGGVALEILYGETVGGNNSNPTAIDLPTTTLPPAVTVMNASPSDRYTVIMYDPDAVGKAGKTTYLHWCVFNRTATAPGETCMTYKAPSPPPKSGIHRYTFALYKQSTPLACKPMPRTPFDIQEFETSHGLTRVQKVVFTIDSEV
jgi:Cu-Zn family superoxide dismutase